MVLTRFGDAVSSREVVFPSVVASTCLGLDNAIGVLVGCLSAEFESIASSLLVVPSLILIVDPVVSFLKAG